MISIDDSNKVMFSKENIKVIKNMIHVLNNYQDDVTSKELNDKIFKKKSKLLMDLAQFYYYSKKYKKADNIYDDIRYEILNLKGTIKFIELYKQCCIQHLETLISKKHYYKAFILYETVC